MFRKVAYKGLKTINWKIIIDLVKKVVNLLNDRKKAGALRKIKSIE